MIEYYDYENKKMFQNFQICFILARILYETYCANVVDSMLMEGLTNLSLTMGH